MQWGLESNRSIDQCAQRQRWCLNLRGQGHSIVLYSRAVDRYQSVQWLKRFGFAIWSSPKTRDSLYAEEVRRPRSNQKVANACLESLISLADTRAAHKAVYILLPSLLAALNAFPQVGDLELVVVW